MDMTQTVSEMNTRKKPKNGWKIALGIIISIVFLGLALHNIDFVKLWGTVKTMNVFWLLLSGVFIFVAIYMRALLWYQLLKKVCPPHIWNFFRIIFVGYFGNFIFPLKLGEVIRAWLLSKTEKVSTSTAIGTVVLERGMDLLAMLIFFILLMCLIPFDNWLKLSGLILAGVGSTLFVVVLLNYRYGGHVLDFIEKPLQKLPGNIGHWLHKQIDKFLDGLKLIKSPGQFFMAFLCSLLSWMSWIVVIYFTIKAAGLDLPFVSAIFVIVVLNFGLMIPSSPGGLGVFEYMVILALAKYGVDKEVALGIGFVTHMMQYLIVILVGWIFAVQMNISMLQVSKESAATSDSENKVAVSE
jgi:glycosyltransferase 2 family protein